MEPRGWRTRVTFAQVEDAEVGLGREVEAVDEARLGALVLHNSEDLLKKRAELLGAVGLAEEVRRRALHQVLFDGREHVVLRLLLGRERGELG